MNTKTTAEKVLSGYLIEMERSKEEYKLGIRTRADGVINFCTEAMILDNSEAAEWQNKFIAAFFKVAPRPTRR